MTARSPSVNAHTIDVLWIGQMMLLRTPRNKGSTSRSIHESDNHVAIGVVVIVPLQIQAFAVDRIVVREATCLSTAIADQLPTRRPIFAQNIVVNETLN